MFTIRISRNDNGTNDRWYINNCDTSFKGLRTLLGLNVPCSYKMRSIAIFVVPRLPSSDVSHDAQKDLEMIGFYLFVFFYYSEEFISTKLWRTYY